MDYIAFYSPPSKLKLLYARSLGALGGEGAVLHTRVCSWDLILKPLPTE